MPLTASGSKAAYSSGISAADDTGAGRRSSRAPSSPLGRAELWMIATAGGGMLIGVVALTGSLVGSDSLAGVFPGAKPVHAITALMLVILGGSQLCARWRRPAALAAARSLAIIAAVIAAAELLFIRKLPLRLPESWPVSSSEPATLHPYAITAVLLLLLAVMILAGIWRFAWTAHTLGTLILVATCGILFGYAFAIPSFLDRSLRVAPAPATTMAILLLALSGIAALPRGWMTVLMSGTAAGTTTRFLLLAAIATSVLAARLPQLAARQRWYTPEVGLTLAVGVDVTFTVGVILIAGVLLRRNELRSMALDEERRSAAAYARRLIEASLDPLVTISPDGKITDVNAATEQVTGCARNDLIGLDFSDSFTEPEKARDGYRAVLADGLVRDYPLTVRHASGRTTDVLYNASLYRDEAGRVQGVFAAARDITERRQIEAREAAFNRILRAISEANQVLIRDRSEPTLLESFCRVIIEYAGFRLAWIGVVDRELGQVTPVAYAGHNEGYVERLHITLDDSPRGHGPSAQAIKQGRPQIVDDFATDPRTIPWRADALARGLASSAVFPLFRNQQTWGALTVYADHPGAFRGEAGALLDDLAANLGRTLETIAAEKERAEADERVRIAYAYNRNLIETSLDPLVTISAEGKITDVNAATEAATGCNRDELIGSDFSNYFTEPERARAGYRQALAEGQIRNYALTILHRDGVTTDVLYNASVYRDSEGAVQGVFAAARDVTERKRAEQAVLRSEAILRRTQDISRVGGWEYDIVAGRLTWTDEVYRIYEVPPTFDPNDVERALAFYAPDERPVIDAAFRGAVERGETYDLELKFVTGRGRQIWVRTLGQPQVENGKVVRVDGFIMDVTVRKSAEIRLIQTLAELERSNKELEQFAYVASHDLQEPLRMVSSFTQLLAQRYSDQLDSDAHEFIDYAVDGAKRMQRLINDLLMYSRVGSRGRPLEPTDSHSAFGKAVANLRSAIEESGALLTTGELPMVKADEGQLVQLFQNLLGNAMKFRRPDVVPRIHVTATASGEECTFSVRDNGIGIDPEFYSRLFVIFQRLHRGDEYPGTGIGLAVCKRIVERHGGRIWVESQPGQGSTFHFTMSSAGEALTPAHETASHAEVRS